jgi:hypothetical protein
MRYDKMINKNNKELFISTLKDGLDTFLKFVEELGTPETAYKYGCLEHYRYRELAKHLRDHLDDIALHVHGFCFNPQRIGEELFPRDILHILYDYRTFCYNDRVNDPEKNFQSLEEQNDNTKNYVHFDFSVKKIKTLKDI